MLESFLEGRVYEVLLVTESNVTPVGVVRRGESLTFKLFPGKSFRDLLKNPKASVQLTNDAELIVKYALNMETGVEIEKFKDWRWIKGLPGLYGAVEYQIEEWADEIGETSVLKAKFIPVGQIRGKLMDMPFSRADCALVEMAVLFTRYLVKPSEEVRQKLLELSYLYTHLGGRSDAHEYMVARLTEKGQKN